jgi:ketosteroid isomerase-like protein
MGSETNVALVRRYEQTYNDDIEAFVRECYSEDCVVSMGGGRELHGHEHFLAVERRVLQAAPRRRMRILRTHLSDSGDVAVAEAELLDPDQGDDWRLPFCAVLTCRDGRIVSDWTYADYSRWPYAR